MQKIDQIVDAAEAIAAEIRDNAMRDADRYLAQRRREAEWLAAERHRRLEQAGSSLRDHLTRAESQAEAILDEAERALAEIALTFGLLSKAGASAEATRGDLDQTAIPRLGEDGASGTADASDPLEPSSGSERLWSSVETEAYESALIRATQLAVRGNDRGQIEGALRDEFGLEDPKPIVDEILGI